jgi:hypothetical protein
MRIAQAQPILSTVLLDPDLTLLDFPDDEAFQARSLLEGHRSSAPPRGLLYDELDPLRMGADHDARHPEGWFGRVRALCCRG